MTISAQVSVRRTRADLSMVTPTTLPQIVFFTREHGFAIINSTGAVLVDSAKDAYTPTQANVTSPLVITPTMGSAVSFPNVAESLAALGYAAYTKWEEFRVTETLLPDQANPGKYIKTKIIPPPAFTLYLQEFCDRVSPYQRYLAQYPEKTLDDFMESDQGHKSVAVWFQQDVTHVFVPDEYREFISDAAYGPDVDAPVGDTRRIKNIEKVALKAETVPTTRKINGKPLAGDVALAAADVGAVPYGRMINGAPAVERH